MPFILESLDAKGAEATQHKSPAAFLEHADRMLSAALALDKQPRTWRLVELRLN